MASICSTGGSSGGKLILLIVTRSDLRMELYFPHAGYSYNHDRYGQRFLVITDTHRFIAQMVPWFMYFKI